jgi:hypothetical protein
VSNPEEIRRQLDVMLEIKGEAVALLNSVEHKFEELKREAIMTGFTSGSPRVRSVIMLADAGSNEVLDLQMILGDIDSAIREYRSGL